VIPELRQRFNHDWTQDSYARFLELARERGGTEIGFRLSETPLFLPAPLVAKMARYGQELYAQLASNPAYRKASEKTIPDEFRVPNEDEHPLFIQADFGFIRMPDGALEPRLVEIQGFPSIYGFQLALAQSYEEAYGLCEKFGPHLKPFLSGLDHNSYIDTLRRAVLGEYSPEEVVLLEIEPYSQKTLVDFLVTRKLLGIRIACISEIEQRGRKLFLYGKPVERIYNRVIVDELIRKQIRPRFSWTDELDVEWAGHPNWFFRLSKFSLPWFDHESVPESHFLSDLAQLPDDLENYVLKPLYSFAGLGVVIGPTKDQIAAIGERERQDYILQRKMDFVPTVETPRGMTKAEIRIMYIREGDEFRPVTTVIRTGRGKMMGVDFNKNLDWVGASAGFMLG